MYPKNKSAFVALLAKPNEDVQLSDFCAFACDGTFGIQILPNVWHQPIYPIDDHAEFWNKQGRVHACVACDTVNEFGQWLSVPLE